MAAPVLSLTMATWLMSGMSKAKRTMEPPATKPRVPLYRTCLSKAWRMIGIAAVTWLSS